MLHVEQFFPPRTPYSLTFLCDIARSSTKPRSMLRNATAAISHLYTSLGVSDLTKAHAISLLVTSLIKSGTCEPMRTTRSCLLEGLWTCFPPGRPMTLLTIKMLRLKAITLLALCLMLRPSDIAPKAVFQRPDSSETHAMPFSTEHVKFVDDGSAVLTFFGTKNDTHTHGF